MACHILTIVAYEVWSVGDAYDAYVGRWSRPVADAFLRWLDLPVGGRWVDVGCGTGALTERILALADPAQVVSVDPSEGYLATACARVTDPRADFRIGDAQSLSFLDDQFDAVVSGLALNFVPDPGRAVAEFARLTAPGGVAAAYVWDYAEGMAMLRYFWDVAAALDPGAAELDEALRFPVCRPEPLHDLWAGAGLAEVEVRPVDVPTVFSGFDDYWQPFLGGQGPAPAYVSSLPGRRRQALRDLLRARLPTGPGGTIRLSARAWAVRGSVMGSAGPARSG
jgi:SAM-dependent methyltransferase